MPYPQLVTSKRAEDARLRIEFEERARRQEAVQAQRLIDTSSSWLALRG